VTERTALDKSLQIAIQMSNLGAAFAG
jgi:hypothetical protein